jgi:hypothetical protein
MAEMKTRLNDQSASDFLNKITDQQLRDDCDAIVDIMKAAANAEPRMWGSAIIGFGEYTMTYPNGREMPWMIIGFSPRKQNLTLYVGGSFPERDDLLAQLGKHSTGKGCLYIKRLSDVNIPTLQKMVNAFGETSSLRKRSPEAIVGQIGQTWQQEAIQAKESEI